MGNIVYNEEIIDKNEWVRRTMYEQIKKKKHKQTNTQLVFYKTTNK